MADNIARSPAAIAEGVAQNDDHGLPGGEEIQGAGNANATLDVGHMADDASKPPKSPHLAHLLDEGRTLLQSLPSPHRYEDSGDVR